MAAAVRGAPGARTLPGRAVNRAWVLLGTAILGGCAVAAPAPGPRPAHPRRVPVDPDGCPLPAPPGSGSSPARRHRRRRRVFDIDGVEASGERSPRCTGTGAR